MPARHIRSVAGRLEHWLLYLEANVMLNFAVYSYGESERLFTSHILNFFFYFVDGTLTINVRNNLHI